ncbi:citramalate synthase [Vulcanisaeta distributa]|uniref:Citramalate synthase n=1 Tax=Vulcanisaeta distributa (strain DSM 14429 / JCM 11212 / NBRC 100878 / IC-017) TaxID=572478 RepID=E1QNC3_VULDI|nr:citramalate synthase [Vulcanisaeta distributa]ADN50093.1 2-isopropylmalate synthase/homocitrate synthase family protein [Vulcanisaeta distributa DSM 14429]
MRVEVLDTTLRDGAQMTGVSFTLNDKVRIALMLDDLGVDYIEGGWPGSNPKDAEFFKAMRNYSLSHAKLAAFGMTRRKGVSAKDDLNLAAILDSGVEVAVLVGKSWILHVREVLRVSPEDNLDMVYDSIRYLKDHGLRVIFDAEHFYQGFREDPDYALRVVKTAEEAGADTVVLADTNGAMLPHEVYEITGKVVKELRVTVGVHMHNDSGCAVANTIMGVLAGARHVQGTINGLGERTGNADLTQVIPNLMLKLGFKVLRGIDDLRKLKVISRFVYEAAGLNPNPYQPYVGDYAFSHKAGLHVDGVSKVTKAYEHIDPELIGNTRRFVVSELAGSSNILVYLKDLGFNISKEDPRLRRALERIKDLENRGYSFDLAPASAILIALREMGLYNDMLRVEYWKVVSDDDMHVAIVKVNGELGVAEGVGPVHAIDKALRSVASKLFPELNNVKLTDYRVIIPGEVKGTESVVRVLMEFDDGRTRWRTVGVSTSIIKASVEALSDGLNYILMIRNHNTTKVNNTTY